VDVYEISDMRRNAMTSGTINGNDAVAAACRANECEQSESRQPYGGKHAVLTKHDTRSRIHVAV
jgi:hypothetical protein